MTQKINDQFVLNDLLDDLDSRQLTSLLNWLWINQYPTTRANINSWRKNHSINT